MKDLILNIVAGISADEEGALSFTAELPKVAVAAIPRHMRTNKWAENPHGKFKKLESPSYG